MVANDLPLRASSDETGHPTVVDLLQFGKRRQALDAIDELRTCGLDKELSLPQLVVCGDQSAGTH